MSQKLQYELSAKDRTKAALRSFKKGLSGASKSLFSLKGAITGLAASLGAMRIAQATKDAVNYGAQLQITADKIGLATDSLQSFRLIAEQVAGIQANTLDMGLQRFSRRLGEADQGTGELLGTLRKLGISTRDADNRIKSVKEVLFEYADAVANAESSQEQLLYAFKAFDSEGAVLVGLLKEGGEALRDLFNKGLDSGAVLSSRMTQQAKELNAELSLQTQIINTQLKAALINFGDELIAITTLFAEMARGFRYHFMSPMEKAIETMADATDQELAAAWIRTYTEIMKIEQALRELENQPYAHLMQSQISQLNEDLTEQHEILKGIEHLRNREVVTGNQGSGKGFFSGLSTGLKSVQENLKQTEALGMEFAQKIETNMVSAFDAIIKGTKTLSEGLKDLGRILIQEAMKMIIYRMIIAPFTSMFGGFLDNIGLSAPKGKQYGGSVQKGKPYIVGEAGMEMFVPNQSGTIIPNHKLGGSGTIVQNINISTGVAATVRSEIISLLPSIAEVSKGAMIDSQLRGQI